MVGVGIGFYHYLPYHWLQRFYVRIPGVSGYGWLADTLCVFRILCWSRRIFEPIFYSSTILPTLLCPFRGYGYSPSFASLVPFALLVRCYASIFRAQHRCSSGRVTQVFALCPSIKMTVPYFKQLKVQFLEQCFGHSVASSGQLVRLLPTKPYLCMETAVAVSRGDIYGVVVCR
jgi:hypothetical protein